MLVLGQDLAATAGLKPSSPGSPDTISSVRKDSKLSFRLSWPG